MSASFFWDFLEDYGKLDAATWIVYVQSRDVLLQVEEAIRFLLERNRSRFGLK